MSSDLDRLMLVADPVQKVSAFACACQGASHRSGDNPTPCQDAHLLVSGSAAGLPYLFAAVADGHGSAKHDLSHIGAQLAVQAALQVFQKIMRDYGTQPISDIVVGFKATFPKFVAKAWQKLLEDEQPNTAKEQDARTRYGSTLLVIAAFKKVLLLAQIGDGDIVLFRNDQTEPSEPLTYDDQLVGGSTYSLCSPEADKFFRVKSLPFADARFITLSTDGLRNAYADTGAFHRLLEAMHSNIDQHGLTQAANIIPEYLDRFSEQGSGDDISLVGIRIDKPSQPG